MQNIACYDRYINYSTTIDICSSSRFSYLYYLTKATRIYSCAYARAARELVKRPSATSRGSFFEDGAIESLGIPARSMTSKSHHGFYFDSLSRLAAFTITINVTRGAITNYRGAYRVSLDIILVEICLLNSFDSNAYPVPASFVLYYHKL